MKTLNKIFNNVMSKITKISKPQKDFLAEFFEIVFSTFGRGNFSNFARFSKYNESTFRLNFAKYFDWLNFNITLIDLYISKLETKIGAIDCSFIPKSGKKTFGIDKFWSGVASKALKGIEISALAIINVTTSIAWMLDVTQTPPNISAKEGTKNEYTRVNFYLEQFLDCLPKITDIMYFVADGFYAKKKIFDTFCEHQKHLIVKLRDDANLRFLYKGPPKKGKGAKNKYAGKVYFSDLSKWNFEGANLKYNFLNIYSQTLNSVCFERNLKVVLLYNTKTNNYVLLASTDIFQSAQQIVAYYQLRFQIEFLFRDAKQFMSLNHCQARSEAKLDFHFNGSFAALNLSKAIMLTQNTNSLNNIVRQAYNEKFMNFIFLKLSLKPEFNKNNTILNQIIEFGSLRA